MLSACRSTARGVRPAQTAGALSRANRALALRQREPDVRALLLRRLQGQREQLRQPELLRSTLRKGQGANDERWHAKPARLILRKQSLLTTLQSFPCRGTTRSPPQGLRRLAEGQQGLLRRAHRQTTQRRQQNLPQVQAGH